MKQQENFYSKLKKQSLLKRIQSIHALFLGLVDNETIWYFHTQERKNNPNHFADHPDRRDIELSSRQKENCRHHLKMLKRDIEECLEHLEK